MSDAKTKRDPAARMMGRAMRRCVFCLKSQAEVRKLIESEATRACICDECVGLCVEILEKG